MAFYKNFELPTNRDLAHFLGVAPSTISALNKTERGRTKKELMLLGLAKKAEIDKDNPSKDISIGTKEQD